MSLDSSTDGSSRWDEILIKGVAVSVQQYTADELSKILFEGDIDTSDGDVGDGDEDEDEGSDEEGDEDEGDEDDPSWLDPPYQPQNPKGGAAFFKFKQVGPGRFRIRHTHVREATYLLPTKEEGAVPMPPWPIIKPVVRYSVPYPEYQQLRTQQPLHGKKRSRHARSGGRKDPEKASDVVSPLDSTAWKNRSVYRASGPVTAFTYYNRKPKQETIHPKMLEALEKRPLQQVTPNGWWVYPSVIPEDQPLAWARSTVKASQHLESWPLKYFAVRSAENTIPAHVMLTCGAMLQMALDGDSVSHLGIKAYMKNSESRSDYDAKHIGMSGHYGGDRVHLDDRTSLKQGLRVTKDTTQGSMMMEIENKAKADAVASELSLGKRRRSSLEMAPTASKKARSASKDGETDAIKRLLMAVQQKLAPILLRWYSALDPDAYQFHQLIRSRACAFLKENTRKWALDFGGGFFCMAIGRGRSFNIHTDSTDFCKSYAVVVPFGEFSGGDFALATEGIEIPVKPGQFLMVTASFLPHYITETKGIRYALTCFTDEGIAAKSRDVMVQMGLNVSDLNYVAAVPGSR